MCSLPASNVIDPNSTIAAEHDMRVEDNNMSLAEKIATPTGRALAAVQMSRISGGNSALQDDVLAVEEPLEIRLGCDVAGKRVHRAVSITMRTPGNDEELAVGFLFTEGIIATRQQVEGVVKCGGGNVARVNLQPGVEVDLSRLERHFYATSSCGVCGKASLDAVQVCPRVHCAVGQPVIDASVIYRLPAVLRATQEVFNCTGGLHASALFNTDGELLCLREDVGRHNALDKLIGHEFLAERTPLLQSVLMLSGRVSFELVQKAAVAGIPILAAIGAPSSLAVSLARKHGLTILGFVREDRFNIYTGSERVRAVMTDCRSDPQLAFTE
jgi:FdhD protein